MTECAAFRGSLRTTPFVMFLLTFCFLLMRRSSEAFVVRQSFVRHNFRLGISHGSVIERFDLTDNFNRWRFLQNLLDEEVDTNDANELIYLMLDSFLSKRLDKAQKATDSSGASAQTFSIVESLIRSSSDHGQIRAFSEPQCSPGCTTVLEELENLLPDPRENDDAHKGTWDTVIQLHGREAVKINEGKGQEKWRALCLVTRVLIHLDFLTTGASPKRASEETNI